MWKPTLCVLGVTHSQQRVLFPPFHTMVEQVQQKIGAKCQGKVAT
jgi:hypothetical protein